jgi:hypothetical protein
MRPPAQTSLFLAAIALTFAAQPRAFAQSTGAQPSAGRASTAEVERAALDAALDRALSHAAVQGADRKSEKSLCFITRTSLCLLGRFVVVAVWDNPFANPSEIFNAGALQLTVESGYMWFLDPSDMEIPIKILDFCDQGVFKVFAAGLSNFGVGIGVEDLVSGTIVKYVNPDFQTFNTIIDQNPPFPCP